MLHGAGGTGGSPSISMSPSCCRHVSFFMLICPFLMLSPSFSYAPWRRWDGGSPSISMSPSCCRHVCFLVPTGLSLMRAVSLFMPSVFFLPIRPFLVLPPLLLMLHGAGGTGGRGTLLQDPTFFGAILYAELAFFMLRLSFSYAPWGAFHPSPCLSLHLHVSILLSTCLFSDCEPYLFLCCSCPSCAPWAKGGGRGGHGAH